MTGRIGRVNPIAEDDVKRSRPRTTIKVLRSRLADDRYMGLRIIGNDVDAVGNFAKNSRYANFRQECVRRLGEIKGHRNKEKSEEAAHALENVAYFALDHKTRMLALDYLDEDALERVAKYAPDPWVKKKAEQKLADAKR